VKVRTTELVQKELKKASKSKKAEKEPSTIKLLLIGSPQTGKSTFLKQIQRNFTKGFTDIDREDAQRTMAHNLVLCYRDIIEYLDDKSIKLSKSAIDEGVAYYKKVALKDVSRITKDMVAPSKTLWTEPEVQNVWNLRESINTFLIFNLDYIMENIDRLAEDGAVVTDEDFLRSRQRTMSSSRLEIKFENKKIEIFDMGGQKTSRRQWAQMLVSPTGIVFFAALSDYDVPIFNGSKMKLEDSIDVFDEVTRYPEFKDSSFILMLNKFDVFEEKLKTRSIKEIYSDWEGKEDPKSASKAIGEMFRKRMLEEKRNAFKFNVICALESEQMKKVFLSLRDIFAFDALKQMGL
jgi:GTPase SAR1 family protein